MGHARTRNCGRREIAHRVGRRRFTVIGDDRRSIIIVAEIQSGAAILLDIEIISGLAERSTRGMPARRIVLDLGRHASPLRHHGNRMIHRKAGHLIRDRLAFRLIGIEYCRRSPPVQMRRQLPAQVDGVGNSGIHSVTRIGHPQMRGVAANEDPAIAEAISDQPSTDPVFLAQDAVLEAFVDAEDGANCPVAIDENQIHFPLP